MSRRTERVNELLRVEISELIQRELKDPRVDHGLVSITEVRVSPDFRRATVFVSHLGDDEERKAVLEGLQHSAHFLHGKLAHRVSLRNVPQLVFEFDPSLERGAHLAALIAETARLRSDSQDDEDAGDGANA